MWRARPSHQHVVADQADGQAFQFEIDLLAIRPADMDGAEVRVLGDQLDAAARALEALDGDLFAEARPYFLELLKKRYSPERILNDDMDVNSDLWAFGVTLYEMVAGRRPFRAERRRELIERFKSRLAPDPLPKPIADLAQGQRQREHLRDALDREGQVGIAAERHLAIRADHGQAE